MHQPSPTARSARLLVSCLALAALSVTADAGPPAPQVDLSRHFTGITGTFVLLNGRTREYVRYNAPRAAALPAVLDFQDREHRNPARERRRRQS